MNQDLERNNASLETLRIGVESANENSMISRPGDTQGNLCKPPNVDSAFCSEGVNSERNNINIASESFIFGQASIKESEYISNIPLSLDDSYSNYVPSNESSSSSSSNDSTCDSTLSSETSQSPPNLKVIPSGEKDAAAKLQPELESHLVCKDCHMPPNARYFLRDRKNLLPRSLFLSYSNIISIPIGSRGTVKDSSDIIRTDEAVAHKEPENNIPSLIYEDTDDQTESQIGSCVSVDGNTTNDSEAVREVLGTPNHSNVTNQ